MTKKDEEILIETKEKDKRDVVLKKMIDDQIAKEEAFDNEDYSIDDESENPMTAIEGIRVKK